jgi:beta-lactamase superfamily II metal-dependent hydrolase
MTLFLALALPTLMQAQSRNLDIYWIDVEGGAATLIVTPEGQSLLVDTGNPTPDDRDAKRIQDAVQQAGLKKIDYLLITHFHGDHVGGVPALAKLVPIDHFLDHGDSIEAGNTPQTTQLWEAYKATSAGKRTIVKPGEKLPLKGVEAVVVAANGATIPKPINGGGPNSFCQDLKPHDLDATENQRSAGFLLAYGKFKFLDLGDLTWDKELELACPVNKLGTVTLLQATHHGFVNDRSGAPPHVWALKPQVVVVNNGPRKGWQVSAWDTAQKIQGLEDIWQIHLALATDKDHNVAEEKIANLEPTNECKGHWLKASIARDGKFTLTNGRNGFSKSYAAR